MNNFVKGLLKVLDDFAYFISLIASVVMPIIMVFIIMAAINAFCKINIQACMEIF